MAQLPDVGDTAAPPTPSEAATYLANLASQAPRLLGGTDLTHEKRCPHRFFFYLRSLGGTSSARTAILAREIAFFDYPEAQADWAVFLTFRGRGIREAIEHCNWDFRGITPAVFPEVFYSPLHLRVSAALLLHDNEIKKRNAK